MEDEEQRCKQEKLPGQESKGRTLKQEMGAFLEGQRGLGANVGCTKGVKLFPKCPGNPSALGSASFMDLHVFPCCSSQVNVQDLTSLLFQILPPALLLLAEPKNPPAKVLLRAGRLGKKIISLPWLFLLC